MSVCPRKWYCVPSSGQIKLALELRSLGSSDLDIRSRASKPGSIIPNPSFSVKNVCWNVAPILMLLIAFYVGIVGARPRIRQKPNLRNGFSLKRV